MSKKGSKMNNKMNDGGTPKESIPKQFSLELKCKPNIINLFDNPLNPLTFISNLYRGIINYIRENTYSMIRSK